MCGCICALLYRALARFVTGCIEEWTQVELECSCNLLHATLGNRSVGVWLSCSLSEMALIVYVVLGAISYWPGSFRNIPPFDFARSELLFAPVRITTNSA